MHVHAGRGGYLCTFRPMTSTPSNAPSTPHHLFSATPSSTDAHPVWPAAQSGPPPPMPPIAASTLDTISSATRSSHTSGGPASSTTSAHRLCPGGWGPMPNYYPAPAQPYPTGYPSGHGHPTSSTHRSTGHREEDSETAKPDKFTGREPLKLHPFIVSCVMAFDSRPRKFATDRQRVSYATLYLSDIAMMWWQPILVMFPEPSICNDWGEFVDQLNTYFGSPTWPRPLNAHYTHSRCTTINMSTNT